MTPLALDLLSIIEYKNEYIKSCLTSQILKKGVLAFSHKIGSIPLLLVFQRLLLLNMIALLIVRCVR
jgi:hypothetical protein